MKNRLFTFVLSICISLCLSSLAFAAIDLDLDSDTGSTGSPLKTFFVTIKGGYDMRGKADVELDGSYTITDSYGYRALDEGGSASDKIDIENGFSLSLEAGKTINDMFGIGIGATYQLMRAVDESGSKAEFQFIPIYGLVKIIFNAESIIPFGIVHVGYNFFKANDELKTVPELTWFGDPILMDLEGGLYWGIGGGVMLTNGVQFELLYSVNNGKSSVEKKNNYYDSSYGDYLDEKLTADGTFKYSKITISVGFNF